jgi:hypothetical protein
MPVRSAFPSHAGRVRPLLPLALRRSFVTLRVS